MKTQRSFKAVSLFMFSTLALPLLVRAQTVPPEQIIKEINIYQKGDQWSPRIVSPTDLKNPISSRAIGATVIVGGATGIYLGKFNGQHIIATNAHIAGTDIDERKAFRPSVLFNKNIWAKTVDCVGLWKDIDMALLIVRPYDVNEWDQETGQPNEASYKKAEIAIAGKAVNLSYDMIPAQDTPLINVGYGFAGIDDPKRNDPLVIPEPKIMMDQDCQILSKTGDARFLFDPDDINPLGYAAWSMAHGCDISHGSSGSMLMDRNTGNIIGLVWTGVWTKDGEKPISSEEIYRISKSNDEQIWNRLNYAVPAFKIKQYFLEEIRKGAITGKKASLIKAIVGQK